MTAPRFSAAEITEGYAAMHTRVQEHAASKDWDGLRLNFTEEDVYNPLRFVRMTVRWARVADAHGNLSDEGRACLDQYAGTLGS